MTNSTTSRHPAAVLPARTRTRLCRTTSRLAPAGPPAVPGLARRAGSTRVLRPTPRRTNQGLITLLAALSAVGRQPLSAPDAVQAKPGEVLEEWQTLCM